MKSVHHYANGCFDWLISGQQTVNPWSEAISLLSEKYKRFAFLHPVHSPFIVTKLLHDQEILRPVLLIARAGSERTC